MICYKCKEIIEDKDNYCRFCGAGQGSHIPWYYKLWGVWILFFLIGPFCLWFLYKSPSKNKTAKVLNALIIILVSVILGYKVYIALKNIIDIYSMAFSGIGF